MARRRRRQPRSFSKITKAWRLMGYPTRKAMEKAQEIMYPYPIARGKKRREI